MPSTSRQITSEHRRGIGRSTLGMIALILAAAVAPGNSRAEKPAAAATHTVTIEAMKFSPGVLKVHPGDRVVFQNHDLVPHTATTKAPPGFDSGVLKSGDEWTFVPKETGTLSYACIFHTDMKGSIVVEQP